MTQLLPPLTSLLLRNICSIKIKHSTRSGPFTLPSFKVIKLKGDLGHKKVHVHLHFICRQLVGLSCSMDKHVEER